MKFKFLAILAGAALVFSGALQANAKAWIPPSNDMNTKGVNIVDSFFNTGESLSRLVSFLPPENTSDGSWSERLCNRIGESPRCTFSGNSIFRLSGVIAFGLCTTPEEFNCIKSLAINQPGKPATEATFTGYSPGRAVQPDSTYGLTGGVGSTLWQSNVPNVSGESTYSVLAQVDVSFDSSANKVTYGNLRVSVFPYKEVTGTNFQEAFLHEHTDQNGVLRVGMSGSNPECAWTATGRCGQLEDFAEGTEISVKMNVSSQISGWFSGRIKNPQIAIGKHGPNSNQLEIKGSSVKVPRIAASVPISTKLPYFDEHMTNGGGWIGGTINMPSNQISNAGYIEDFRTAVKDTASGISDVWSVNTVETASNACLQESGRVMGIVSTNAMVYEGRSPTFSNGQLKYKVAGLHFMPDGQTPVEGVYDLVMRSDAARCLYKFTDAPIAASISVTSSNGDIRTAVTNFSEKNGWVHFSAYGFGFSEPQISVKLTQPAPAKKATITCVNVKKPKLTKKVTAVAPKCPTGYKKK